ncbi:MAG: hypothetical protein U0940_03795 [Nitrospirota bacterium]|nr:hypothetical protein [Nitrospirota bacterium]
MKRCLAASRKRAVNNPPIRTWRDHDLSLREQDIKGCGDQRDEE